MAHTLALLILPKQVLQLASSCLHQSTSVYYSNLPCHSLHTFWHLELSLIFFFSFYLKKRKSQHQGTQLKKKTQNGKGDIKIHEDVKMTFEYIKQNGFPNVLKIGAIALKMLQRYYSMSVPLVQTDEFLQLYYTVGKGPYTLIEYFSSFVYYSKLLLL